MSLEQKSEPAPYTPDEPLTPMQEAIRARALVTLENEERLPKPSLRRKFWTGVLAVVTVVLLVVAIDFAVRIVQRILALYQQDETSVPAAAAPFDPSKPMFITVDPPADAPAVNSPAPPVAAGMTAK